MADFNDFQACIGCGAMLHITAMACPKCGAPQTASVASARAMPANTPTPQLTLPPLRSAKRVQSGDSKPLDPDVLGSDYSVVPWYRRRWLVLICLISFTPIASILAMTGDVFYQSKGHVKAFAKNIKTGLMIASLPWLMYVLNSDGASGALAALGLLLLAVVLAFKK